MKEHITIGKKVFVAPIRYMPGHVMTDEEADTFSKFVNNKAQNALNKKEGLTQEELDRWVANYQVGVRKSRVDPEIAELKLMVGKKLKGKKGKELIKARDKLLADPAFIEEARRRAKWMREFAARDVRDG